jgi:hypothetical protein
MRRLKFISLIFICMLVLSACSFNAFESSSAEESEASSASPSADSVSEMDLTLAFSFGERTGVYTGDMVDGLPHGYGTFESRNAQGVGWVYEGGWEMGHLMGEGTTTFETGYKETGWYENDNLNGQGSLYQDDVRTYDGEFTDNTPDGQGTLYSYCGEVIFSGSFSQGYIHETVEARAARLTAFKEGCERQDYAAIQQSATDGNALKVRLSGMVYDVSEDEGGYDSSFIMDDPEGNAVGVSYRLSVGEASIEPGKRVTVWGIADYLSEFETETGGQESLPMVEAWDVRDISGTAL